MIVTADQTRTDLEDLYASVCEGWSCIGKEDSIATRTFGKASGTYMRYGCLFHQMYYITEQQNPQYAPAKTLYCQSRSVGGVRRDAMTQALGFTSGGQMYDWNDDPSRTWDEVKERIKEAIGRL